MKTRLTTAHEVRMSESDGQLLADASARYAVDGLSGARPGRAEQVKGGRDDVG